MKYALVLLMLVCSQIGYAFDSDDDSDGLGNKPCLAAAAADDGMASEDKQDIPVTRWKSITTHGLNFTDTHGRSRCELFMGERGIGAQWLPQSRDCLDQKREIIHMDGPYITSTCIERKRDLMLKWEAIQSPAKRSAPRRFNVECTVPSNEVITFNNILFSDIAGVRILIEGECSAWVREIYFESNGNGDITLNGQIAPSQPYESWVGTEPKTPFVATGVSKVTVFTNNEGKSSPTKRGKWRK